MKPLALLLLLAIGLSRSAAAGDWQPNPDEKHELVAPREAPAAPTATEEAWVASLLRNLESGVAFVHRSRPDVFLIADGQQPFARFVVDFEQRTVDAPGWGTIYLPPSRRFCVVVFEREYPLRGIPVGGAPGDPTIDGRKASWF